MEGDCLDNGVYFDDLLAEIRLLNQIRSRDPTIFSHTTSLLSSEISRVWAHLSGEVLAEVPSVQLEEKIPIPQQWDGMTGKMIGRILGPAGLSVKQLEAETGCQILIRGSGSIKDAQKEAFLRGTFGFEHLDEPLHIFVKTKDRMESTARMKLMTAVRAIKKLLKRNQYDEYKKKQLVTHAIITGTYRSDYQRKKKKKTD